MFSNPQFVLFIFIIFNNSILSNYGQSCIPENPKRTSRLAQSSDCGLITKIPGDERSLAPWNAGIFIRTNSTSKFKFLLSGVIFSSHSVISVGGGSVGSLPKNYKGEYKFHNPEDILIGAGLKTTNLEKADKFSQFSEVSYISPYRKHKNNNNEFHFLIFHLKTPFNFTAYVREVCLFCLLNKVRYNPKNWSFYQTGFSIPANPEDGSLVLRGFNVSDPQNDVCEMASRYYYKKTLPNTLLCGRITRGEEHKGCHGHGSGIIFGLTNRWFLTGLVTLIPEKRWKICDQNSLYFYGNALESHVVTWLYQNYICDSNSFSCDDGNCIPLNQVCDGNFHCKDKTDEDELFCMANSKYKKSQLLLNFPNENVENQYCDDFYIAEGVSEKCFNKDEYRVSCGRSLIGTKAVLKCENFKLPFYNRESVEMVCEKNGKWSGYRPFTCQTSCGLIPNLKNNAQISNSFPWTVLLFRMDEDYTEETFKFICSASLIEKLFVITSANCIHEISNVTLNEWRIVLNSVSNIYSENLNNQDVQILKINESWILPDFLPNSDSEDLGILKLNEPAQFNKFVQPVCYLKKKFKNLEIGSVGKLSANLNERKILNYSVISKEKCQLSLGILASNTFCVESNDEFSDITAEDELGAGIYYTEKIQGQNTYILKGIATITTKIFFYGEKDFRLFTNVNDFAEWIVDILQKNS